VPRTEGYRFCEPPEPPSTGPGWRKWRVDRLERGRHHGLQISDYRKPCPDMMADCYAELFDWFAAGQLVS
jgi:hypothetical protein